MLQNNYEESYFTYIQCFHEGFYLDQTWISITLELCKCVPLYAPTSISEDHEHNSISQKGISEAREIFYKVSSNSQTNISEA